MSRIPALLSVAAMLLATPALAQDNCERWTAEVWEVEGGKAMTASTCAPATSERQPMLYLQCYEPGALVLTFDDGGKGEPPGGNYEYTGTFGFAAGGKSFDRVLGYMAMDGVMVAEIKADDPLIAQLRGGGELAVTVPDPTFSAARFPLVGAAEALDTLTAQCGPL